MAENYLVHFGAKGQKWGKRRYQNYDGTLTEEGKLRYYKNYSPENRQLLKNNAILRGDVRELAANRDYFSRTEKEELLKNDEINRKIDEAFSKKYSDTGKKTTEKLMETIHKVAPTAKEVGEIAVSLKKAYDAYQAFKKHMPGDGTKDKDK